MILLLLFLEGILAFISPCILPMVPVYLIYLSADDRAVGAEAAASTAAGTASKSALDEKRKMRIRLLNTLAFILGFTIIFVGLGALASSIGAYLNAHINTIRKVSAGVMVLIGVYYLDLIHLPSSWSLPFFKKKQNKADEPPKTGGVLRSFFFGLAFSTTWLPCVGTFLASALTLAANHQTVYQGMALLFVFAMGLGIPFILTALLFEKLRSTFNFLKKHARVVRIVSGLLLILLGLAMLFDLQGNYMKLFL